MSTTFKFECPHCGQRISAVCEDSGTEALCPSCTKSITVPKKSGVSSRACGEVTAEARPNKLLIIALVLFLASVVWSTIVFNSPDAFQRQTTSSGPGWRSQRTESGLVGIMPSLIGVGITFTFLVCVWIAGKLKK